MKLFSVLFVTLFAFSQAHFDLEKYASVYRNKRAEYLEAKQELVLAEGPYLAARNAYIASTAVLSNAAIPDTDADPHHVTEIGADDGIVDHVDIDGPSPIVHDHAHEHRRLRAKPRRLEDSNGDSPAPEGGSGGEPGDEGELPASEEGTETHDHEHAHYDNFTGDHDGHDHINGGPDAGDADAAVTGVTQQSQFYEDYLSARTHWLDAKTRVSNLEGPYLAAREAYVFAAQTYSNSLLPSGIGHLYEPVFNEDNFRPHVHIHTN